MINILAQLDVTMADIILVTVSMFVSSIFYPYMYRGKKSEHNTIWKVAVISGIGVFIVGFFFLHAVEYAQHAAHVDVLQRMIGS